MTTLLEQHNDFIARVKARGGKTATYRTPCCKKPLEDRLATAGECWDTMSVCPYCGAHYIKIASEHAIVGKLLKYEVLQEDDGEAS